MPSTMIHLLTAYNIAPCATGEFWLGCFAPDYTNDSITKDTIHLRNTPDRWEALASLYKTIDKNNPFEQGWFIHLFTDACWDTTQFVRYRMEYSAQDGWFQNYRKEIGIATFHLYHILPWANDVWAAINAVNVDGIRTSMPVKPADNAWYRDRVYHKHLESGSELSLFYTDDILYAFAHDTAERYSAWLREWNENYYNKRNDDGAPPAATF